MYKNNESQDNYKRMKFIFVIVGITVMVLMLLSTLLSIFSTESLMNELNIMSEHPVVVINAAGKLRAEIESMRIRTERLLYNNSEETVESVRVNIQGDYDDINGYMKIIRDKYLGNRDDVDMLYSLLTAINERQDGLLDYALSGSRSRQDIVDYCQDNLNEYYDKAADLLDKLDDTANRKFEECYVNAQSVRNNSVFTSIVILIAVMAAIIIYRWIMSRQQREILYRNKLFELLSETIDHVFLMYSPNNQQGNYVSENIQRILGVSTGEVAKNMDELKCHMETADRAKLDMNLESEADTCFGNIRYTHPVSNDERILTYKSYRVKGKYRGDSNYQYLLVFTDETEDIKNREKLRAAIKRAEVASNAKSEFLSRMSHEIRTPMNGVMGMTLVALQHLDDKQRLMDCLKKINISSKHLLVLINDVLDMNKIESGKIEIKKSPFDFRVFVESVTNIIYGQARDKEIDFEVIIVGDIDNYLQSDMLRVNQIIMNLMSNALKFTPVKGRVVLRISVMSREESELWLRFEVKDTGCGISKENYDKIFRPFEQENDSVSHSYGGTGLGLSISKRFVEILGGRIYVDSQLGQGTTFTVELPFEIASEGAAETEDVDFGGLRALVVDDEPEICQHLVLLFDKIGIEADSVDNGYEAVAKVQRSLDMSCQYDVCLVDWKMPYIDGIEITRRIRSIEGTENMAVILISAYDTSEIEDQAKAAGADGVLAKPLFESTLVDALKSVHQPHTEPEAKKHADQLCDLKGKRVLIVEDNELNMEIAVELLSATQAEIETAENGKISVDMFSQSEPGYYDMILMDLQMPVMDGYKATAAIRSMDRPDAVNVPIIAMTANAFEEDVQRCLKSGMNGHISKPIDVDEMLRKLGAAFNERNKANSLS